jgi:ribosomal protein S18 acetylase RimI-like enzyme
MPPNQVSRVTARISSVSRMTRMPDFTLRPATEADFEAVLDLSIRVMRPHLDRLGRFDPARRRARMRHQFDAGILRVIEDGGAMLGCIGVEAHAAHVEIQSLFLEPGAQGRGLGAAVWRAVLAEHPGRAFRLDVLKESPARRFWERQGFVRVGELPFDWLMGRAAD